MSLHFVINYTDYDQQMANRLAESLDSLGYTYTLLEDTYKLKISDVATWCRRYLQIAKIMDSDYLIKLDPDALVRSPIDLSKIPDADIFGSIARFRGGPFALGGAFGMRRAAAIKLYGMLAQPGISSEARMYVREGVDGADRYFAPIEEDILSIVAARGKLSIAAWDDIKCVFRPYQDPDQPYAIIHPVAPS